VSDNRVTFVQLGADARLRRLAQRAVIEGRAGRLDSGVLSELFDALIRPLPLGGAKRLVTVLTDGLFQLPFAAFQDSTTGRYLVQDVSLSSSPSLLQYAQAWQLARAMAPPEAAVVIHASEDGGRWPRLPHASREAGLIAALYPRASLLSGRDVRVHDFTKLLEEVDVLHFAGHAVANPTFPELSFLVLNDDPSQGPALVFARDVTASRFRRLRTVVLGACDTSSNAATNAGPQTLAAAFLEARVTSVVASLWKLSDTVSLEVMPRVHQEIRRGAGGADALRVAQIAAIERGVLQPAQWSGLVAMGL
jgi:CHAT domain-containing protein